MRLMISEENGLNDGSPNLFVYLSTAFIIYSENWIGGEPVFELQSKNLEMYRRISNKLWKTVFIWIQKAIFL